jgi:serine/threonine protein kinase
MAVDSLTNAPREGEVIAGKYRVERVLGVGGMGVVVAAHHIGLDEKVAIKFLLPEMLRNKGLLRLICGREKRREGRGLVEPGLWNAWKAA